MKASHSMRLRAAALILTFALPGCRQPQPPAPQPSPPRFIAEAGVLYRVAGGGRTPVLALDSAHAPAGVAIVPAQWAPAPGAVFSVAATAFRHVVAAPGSGQVAWETNGTHELIGIVPASGGNIVVLDFLFDSSARELRWAPAGRFLAAFYTPPSGQAELRVYDARNGTRLATPWSKDCRPESDCQVVAAEWTGPSTISVRTSTNGTAREYRADVSRL